MGFFEKKILNFIKIAKGSKFAVEWVPYGVIFPKNVSSALIMRFIWQKKTENFERWKNQKL